MKTLKKEEEEKIKYLMSKYKLDVEDRRLTSFYKKIYLFNYLRNRNVKLQEIADFFNLQHSSVINGIRQYRSIMQMNDNNVKKQKALYYIFLIASEIDLDNNEVFKDPLNRLIFKAIQYKSCSDAMHILKVLLKERTNIDVYAIKNII